MVQHLFPGRKDSLEDCSEANQSTSQVLQTCKSIPARGDLRGTERKAKHCSRVVRLVRVSERGESTGELGAVQWSQDELWTA